MHEIIVEPTRFALNHCLSAISPRALTVHVSAWYQYLCSHAFVFCFMMSLGTSQLFIHREFTTTPIAIKVAHPSHKVTLMGLNATKICMQTITATALLVTNKIQLLISISNKNQSWHFCKVKTSEGNTFARFYLKLLSIVFEWCYYYQQFFDAPDLSHIVTPPTMA